jgi:hypothetical protein
MGSCIPHDSYLSTFLFDWFIRWQTKTPLAKERNHSIAVF